MDGGFSFKCSSRLLALKQRRSHEAALFCSQVYMSQIMAMTMTMAMAMTRMRMMMMMMRMVITILPIMTNVIKYNYNILLYKIIELRWWEAMKVLSVIAARLHLHHCFLDGPHLSGTLGDSTPSHLMSADATWCHLMPVGARNPMDTHKEINLYASRNKERWVTGWIEQ